MLITAQERGDMTGLDRHRTHFGDIKRPSTHFERPGVAMVGQQSQVREGLEGAFACAGRGCMGPEWPHCSAAPAAALLPQRVDRSGPRRLPELRLSSTKSAWRMSQLWEP